MNAAAVIARMARLVRHDQGFRLPIAGARGFAGAKRPAGRRSSNWWKRTGFFTPTRQHPNRYSKREAALVKF